MSNLITIQNGQAVVSSRQVAENFSKNHRDVLEAIREIIGSAENSATPMYYETTYIHPQNKQEYPEYLMNRDGFTLLAMGFTGSTAMEWKIKYIQAFNEMEKQITSLPQMSQIQIIAAIAQTAAEQEQQLKEIAATQANHAEQLQGIRDVVALSPNSWRQDSAALLNKMALSAGGYEHLRDIRAESYKLLDERFGVDLQTRLTNKRRRMADEGVCKSKRDKLNQLDVIGDDKKLIEGYVAIIKEMAIKYGA
ncbi:MAG: Rha family transcriptional regulator [Sporomusaceae bacterium]|nr:Rha family transcriptional regulator [Sporomusaceae bacterium]